MESEYLFRLADFACRNVFHWKKIYASDFSLARKLLWVPMGLAPSIRLARSFHDAAEDITARHLFGKQPDDAKLLDFLLAYDGLIERAASRWSPCRLRAARPELMRVNLARSGLDAAAIGAMPDRLRHLRTHFQNALQLQR